MAENKNQHYVPKGLLKPFTRDEKGISLEMLLLKTGVMRSDVSVSTQCSKPYFYGSDSRLEHAIQSMETDYGVLRNSIVNGSFSPKDSNQTIFLNRFILLQYYRTLTTLRHNADAMTLMREGLNRLPGSDLEPLPDERTLTQFAMRAYVENMPMLDDLAVCTVRNETDADFIIGDNPAVHTNRWQLQKLNREHFGPGHAGAIFILPISPRVAVISYDKDIYNVDHNAGVIRSNREEDIETLNILQLCNATSSAYFSCSSERPLVEALYRNFRANWPSKLRGHSLRVAQLERQDEEYREYLELSGGQIPDADELLVHVRQQHARLPRWPKFIRYRARPRYFDTRSARGHIRYHTGSWHHGSDWF